MVDVTFKITEHRFPWYWELTGRYHDLEVSMWRYAPDEETAGSRAMESLSQIKEEYWKSKQMEIQYEGGT